MKKQENKAQRCSRPTRLVLACTSLTMLLAAVQPVLAAAADAPSSRSANEIDYDIPAGPLDSVLIAIARRADKLISYDAELVRPYTSSGIKGRHTAAQAIDLALRGSNLRAEVGRDGSYTIARGPAAPRPVSRAGGAASIVVDLPAIDVTGNAGYDPTLTEGTGSYTAEAVTIGGKTARTLREIPQSVSVVTRQRIEEQNLTDLNTALEQMTGITVIGGSFYSRGFEIENIQLDGGAALNSKYLFSAPVDLAQYDHVETLRGADGVFSGVGSPGGTINLVRKRPLRQPQILVQGTAGSWKDFSGTLDVTGPLGQITGSDALRGRFVARHQRRDFFYDLASQEQTLLYGALETDVSSSTIVGGGASHTKRNGFPTRGLLRHGDGSDLRQPRSTVNGFPWNRSEEEIREVFFKLEHKFNDKWAAKFNFTNTRYRLDRKYGYLTGAVDPETDVGARLSGNMDRVDSRRSMADLTLDGKFNMLGRQHELVAGINGSSSRSPNFSTFYNLYSPIYQDRGPLVDYRIDPRAVPEPADAPPDTFREFESQKQLGAYSTLRLSLADPVHLALGVRYTNYDNKSASTSFARDGSITADRLFSHYRERGKKTPYASLSYDIDRSWSVYASYTDIFESQSNQLDASGNRLPPIVGKGYEAGAKGALFDGKANASLSVYRIVRENVGTEDNINDPWLGVNGSWCCSIASDKSVSRGLDAEIAGELRPDWHLSAGYTLNLNRWVVNQYLEYFPTAAFHDLTPRHLFKVWSTYRLSGNLRPWTVGGGVVAQSRTGSPGLGQGGYAVVGARVGHEFNRQWSAAININNLLDRTYYAGVGSGAGNRYGEPRNFQLIVQGKF